jgi:transcriptional regulator
MVSPLSILPGSVEFFALAALARGGRMHGFEILRWIEDRSEGAFLVEEGALYPALHRIRKRGLAGAEWGVSEKGRRARYYTITPEGERALDGEMRTWDSYVTAVARVVEEG